MIRKSSYILLFILALASSACAITITSDVDTDLGYLAAGSSITLNLTASGYEPGKPSDIVWQLKANDGENPGFRLDRRRGDSVKLFVSSLAITGKDGSFSITVSARDAISSGDITITGRAVSKPKILTGKLEDALAGGERKYIQRLEFNPGSEPLELDLTGNIPEGLSFGSAEERGSKYHVLTGNINQPGTYTFTLTAENPVGSDSRELTLQAVPLKPRIQISKDFPRNYLVYVGSPFYIDLSTLQFTGSSPLEIDIDENSKRLGLEYDSEKKMIKGTIPEGAKTKKHNVKLRASNPYGSPASRVFTLNVSSIPVGFKLSTNEDKIQHFTEDGTDISAVPILAGRPFRTQFKSDIGTKPITWDYVITGMDESINGKKIVADLDGKFGGLVFASDGSITGTPEGTGNISFVAEASNPAGIARSGVYEFVFGTAPAFDSNKVSVPVTLIKGKSISISIEDYMMPSSNGVFTETFTADGSFPPGMSFDGKTIKGIPIALDPSHFTKYPINFSAANAFGTARARLILDFQDSPDTEDISE